MQYDKPSTWITIYSSVLSYRGLYGYSYSIVYDGGNISKTGVFKPKLVDHTHAKLAAIGAALSVVRTELKYTPIAGITIYTDDLQIINALHAFLQHGSIAMSNKNISYVIGLNRLLRSINCKRWNIQRTKERDLPEWLKTAIFNKLKKHFVDTKIGYKPKPRQ